MGNGGVRQTRPKVYYSAGGRAPSPGPGDDVEAEDSAPLRSAYDATGSGRRKPDGGWGWLVVLGVAVSNMTTQSILSVFGLLFLERLSELGINTRGASVIVGVQTTCLNFSGLVAGPVIKRFSYRKTAFAGAAMFTSGLLLTTRADSLVCFVFTYGVFTGVGLGLLYPSTFCALDAYFDRRRGRAVGLAAAGTGTGQMLLPLLVQHLLAEYGFSGTVLVLAALSMHSILGAALFQPVEHHLKVSGAGPHAFELETIRTEEGPKTGTQLDSEAADTGLWSKLKRSFNLELLASLSFVNLLAGLALVYVSNVCFSMLLPFFLEGVRFTRPEIALCLSVLSAADIVGRLVVPVFNDLLGMRSRTVFFAGAALSALFRSALALQRSYLPTMLVAALCGLVRAALVCNFNLSISENVRPEKLPSALGLHMLFKGVAIMVFAPIVGFIRDTTRSYALCLHILSLFFLLLPFVAWLAEFLRTRRRHPPGK